MAASADLHLVYAPSTLALMGLLRIRIMEKPWLGLFDELEDAVGNLMQKRQLEELTTSP